MKFPKLSSESKKRIASDIGFRQIIQIPRYAMAGAASFAILLLVFIAQAALPGSWLYPVKRGTEQVRSVVQPNFEDSLVDVRKEEVEQLKQEAAPLEKVEKAEKEYHRTQEKVEYRKWRRHHNENETENQDNQRDDSKFHFRKDDSSSTSDSQDFHP